MTDTTNTETEVPGGPSELSDELFDCRQCLRDRRAEEVSGWPAELTRMIICPTCGNKRCPHATDHRNACTGSNDLGQAGSAYAECKPHNGPHEGPGKAQL